MIDINSAIEESKNKKNISDGGSKCFDFGDNVLVKYSCPIKYLKNGEHTREKSEEIMEAINKKANDGVNTPRHLAVKRVIEAEDDVCYVLQQKCPGRNCASMFTYGVPYDEAYKSLKYVLNIPFEHYEKLIEDGFDLFEMGYESKNKNLFYDTNSGFWFIDFLDNEKNYTFDPNDITKVFEALKNRMPKPVRVASSVGFGEKLTEEQSNKINELKYAIEAKTLLAIKSVLPNFEKYEKFFLLEEDEYCKQYLMSKGIVKQDITKIDSEDYEVFNELYEVVINRLIDKVVNRGEKFWSIECNDIRNDSGLFNLQLFFENSKYNSVNISEFDNKYDYEYEVRKLYTRTVLTDLVNRIKQLTPNENINKFLVDADAYFNKSSKGL